MIQQNPRSNARYRTTFQATDSYDRPGLFGHRQAMSMAILALVFLFSISPAAAQPPLISHWNFEEGVGSIASDHTDNSHDATLVGPFWDVGRIGTGSVSLDGFDDYLDVANPDPLHIATGDYSFFAWVNTVNPDFETIIADRNTGIREPGFFLRVGNSSGDGELFVHLEAGVERKQYATVSSDLDDGAWHHVGFTWENATDTLRVYVDGMQVTDVAKLVDHPLAGDSIGSTNNLEIGRRPNNDQHFQGGIDDVRIYRSALSAAEILALHSGAPTITILEPDGPDTADQNFTIVWTDNAPDHDASIALYHDLDSVGADGFLIVENLSEDDEADQYAWDVSALDPGDYYVYGVIDNGTDPVVTSYSTGTVTVDHGVADNLGDHIATQNIQLNGNFLSYDGDDEGILVSSIGDVGIGTSTPDEKLHVAGNIAADGTVCDGSGNCLDAVGGEGSSNSLDAADGDPTDVVSVNSAGDVGVGTTDPHPFKLLVKQNANNFVGGIGVQANGHQNPSTRGAFWGVLDHGEMYFGTTTDTTGGLATATKHMSIRSDGNVGIGTATPQAKLEVSASPEAGKSLVVTEGDVEFFFDHDMNGSANFIIDNQNENGRQWSMRSLKDGRFAIREDSPPAAGNRLAILPGGQLETGGIVSSGDIEASGSVCDASGCIGDAAPLQIREALITYDVPSGTPGGPSSSGWKTRSLNTTVYDLGDIVFLSANQILLEAGTYSVSANQVFFSEIDRIKSVRGRFRNISESATVAVSMTGRLHAPSGVSGHPEAEIPPTVFSIDEQTAFELQYFVEVASSDSDSLGLPSNTGEPERYASVHIRKIGD